MPVWTKSLAGLVLVTSTGLLLDRVLRYEGMSSRELLFFSDLLVGLVAAVLVYTSAVFADRKERAIAGRVKVIAEMNHHVRNALQVIVYHASSREDEKEIAAITESVKRISWALREILPQMPDFGDDPTEHGSKPRFPKLES
jgi:hypothetical protein